MNADQIILLVPFAALAAGLSVTLYLFLSLKRDLARLARRTSQKLEEPVHEPARLREGMNYTKRHQALRLLRRGETIPHVAAALGVPQGEIELLAKLTQELCKT